MTQAHAGRAHALLGASSASRWIACPPSARLTEHVIDAGSEYAQEGTLAHELSEIHLQRQLFPCNSKERKRLEAAHKKIQSNPMYSGEMEEAVQQYVDFVVERYMAAKARSKDALVLLEESLDFSEWVPEGFGTGDVVLIADGVLEVIDLKFGKGVAVSAKENPQIRLYGLGAYSGYSYLYDIHEIHMTIVQPRLDSISTDIMAVDDLLQWAEETVKPAAELAHAGEGELQAGEHCRWCKVKGNCRARADANMQALEKEFQDPALLSLEEVGQILPIADQLRAWAKDVEDYAFEQALKGEKIPHWKLVEGRSNRKIVDEKSLQKVLVENEFTEDSFTETKMLGITKLETLVGKKKLSEIAGDLIQKPPGKPVLVPETDQRPELSSVENDFDGEEFSD